MRWPAVFVTVAGPAGRRDGRAGDRRERAVARLAHHAPAAAAPGPDIHRGRFDREPDVLGGGPGRPATRHGSTILSWLRAIYAMLIDPASRVASRRPAADPVR